MRGDLPSGTVTFLFTDVEGSTKLLHELGTEAYDQALIEHRQVLREAFVRHGGVEVDTQGDAFFYAFPTADGALSAAGEGTAALEDGPIAVRMGLHTGTPHMGKEGYIGDDVHLGARIAASAHGGQVILSAATAELAELELTYLGEHRLKDIAQAVPIYQLGTAAFPPLKTISNTNLPRPASSFLGREIALRELISKIEAGARLVTLTGPGGTGKTRLAIEAAAELVPDFKAGVFWVGLASVRDPALVMETIAQTLGAKDGLAEHIGERDMLLLLDNLEQVIEAAPELSTLLPACPNLTVLVTSRELMRVPGEVEFPVPPLAESEAVSLFCARSQLEATHEIAELCTHVDNLPLTVELAAARATALSPAQIRERLSQRLDLLQGGRGADPRQRTLRATIAWSYELLSPEEQQLFARLSVFFGGCALEAAEEVCDANVDTLQSLVEKSLLRVTDERYRMLETIREYALERLEEAGDAGDLRDFHAAWFSAFAENAKRRMGPEQPRFFDLLEREHANLRAALDWADQVEDHGRVLSFNAALGYFWASRGHVTEGRARHERALAAPTPSGFEGLRVEVLMYAASAALYQGDLERAETLAEEAVRLARECGPDRSIGLAVSLAGNIRALIGDFERAEELQIEALERFRRSGDDYDQATAVCALSDLALRRRDFVRAEHFAAESLALTQAFGDETAIGVSLMNLGISVFEQQRPEEARKHAADAVEHLASGGDDDLTSYGVEFLADAIEAEWPREAARLLGLAAAIRKALGLPRSSVEQARMERTLKRVRTRLGQEEFASIYDSALRREAPEAVAEAVVAASSVR